MPIEFDWESPTAKQSLAARLLTVDALASIEQGVPAPKMHLAALEDAFVKAFGVGTSDLWIPTYVRHLERARLELAALETRAAIDPRDRSQNTFIPANADQRRSSLAARVVESTHARLASFALVVAELNYREPESKPRDDAYEASTLPVWVDEPLTAILITKFSCGRGGGVTRSLSRATLVRLLADPAALGENLLGSRSAAVREIGRRLVARASEGAATPEQTAT